MKSQLEQLAQLCLTHNISLSCAESCSGGWLAKHLTDLPGSSAWFLGGVVSYSNQLKQRALGVEEALLAEHGAVSLPVAQAMASGVLMLSQSHFAVSITGIAGPGGGSEAKPVGTVCFGLASNRGPTRALSCQFAGDRNGIRLASVEKAIDLVLGEITASL